MLKALKERDVDLGYKANGSKPKQLLKNLREALGGHAAYRAAQLRSRFEFSCLARPTAAASSRIPTRPARSSRSSSRWCSQGEWDPGYGGGTDVNRPRDPRKTFNQLNAQAEFDDMEILDTFEFSPNQAVMFVKTFNSWHSVRPMTGSGRGPAQDADDQHRGWGMMHRRPRNPGNRRAPEPTSGDRRASGRRARSLWWARAMYFSYDNLHFRYEPFPVGLAKPLMSDDAYRQLIDNFPAIDRFDSFEGKGKRGRKYMLSEKENPRAFEDFVQGNPVWREFHRWIKSDDFVYGVLDALEETAHRPRLSCDTSGQALRQAGLARPDRADERAHRAAQGAVRVLGIAGRRGQCRAAHRCAHEDRHHGRPDRRGG